MLIYEKIKKYIATFLCIQKFKKENKKFFKSNKSSKITLIEFNAFYSTHFFLALISNFFSKKFDTKILAYFNHYLINSDMDETFKNKIKYSIGKLFGLGFFGIYKSLGICGFIKPNVKHLSEQADKIFNEINKTLKSKQDVLDIKIDDIYLGDLIYDGFLRYNLNYTKDFTINISDTKFKNYLKNFIKLYLFWSEYFQKNNVHTVIGAICYYSHGLILRVAISKNIKVFSYEGGQLFKLSKERHLSHLEFRDFRKVFKSLNEETKKDLLSKAQKSIKNRLDGKVKNSIDELVTTRSAFASAYNKDIKILKENKKIKVLISSHNIGDVSNAFGKNHFTDFYEWLNFLGQMSQKTDFDWYIKDHPYYKDLKYSTTQEKSYRLSNIIINKFPNITRLDPNTSHHQLVNEGINFVLTVYGTIAWEYAYLGIPVLTASQNCRTIDYDFNIHTKDKIDYESKILNLDKINFKFNKEQILEYYAMRYIYYNHDALFEDYSNFVKNDKFNWDSYDSTDFYNYLLKRNIHSRINILEKRLEKFFMSDDYHLSKKHNYI